MKLPESYYHCPVRATWTSNTYAVPVPYVCVSDGIALTDERDEEEESFVAIDSGKFSELGVCIWVSLVCSLLDSELSRRKEKAVCAEAVSVLGAVLCPDCLLIGCVGWLWWIVRRDGAVHSSGSSGGRDGPENVAV